MTESQQILLSIPFAVIAGMYAGMAVDLFVLDPIIRLFKGGPSTLSQVFPKQER